MKTPKARAIPPAVEAAPASATPSALLEPPTVAGSEPRLAPPARRLRKFTPAPSVRHFAATAAVDEVVDNRQAELFYLQKQIQLQTQMVFVLEDGSRIQGLVEWYDRNSIKVRGKTRVLVYKSAIKYLFKHGESGSTPGE
jgi:sRNA-binding regulator protein Hfq